MVLDLTALRDSLTALNESLGYVDSELARHDPKLRLQFRTACIKGFEIVYEVAHKMIRRQLEQMSDNPNSIRQLNYRDMIRTASESGLIVDPNRFWEYREKRSVTNDYAAQRMIDECLSSMPTFVQDVTFLLNQLSLRNQPETR